MIVPRVILAAVLVVAVPAAAAAEVIPISAVNEDDEDGQPVLWTEVVTVRGVVTIGTGVLAANNDLYIEDGTGGLNIVQPTMASPAVAPGDSVLVTGRVALENGNRTSIRVDTSITPGARIEILNTGNPVPDPFELTIREVALGEAWEGRYAVVRDVWLPSPTEWPEEACSVDGATLLADGDTTCRIWFDANTDLCGSPAPLDLFDVYGVVIPRPRIVPSWSGHGMLPPARLRVLSHGSGAGFVGVEPGRVFVGEAVRLAFDLRGEADVLTAVAIEIPDGWTFSGSEVDVSLAGAGLADAWVDGPGTTPDVVVIEGCTLVDGAPGTVSLSNLTAAGSAGEYAFAVRTAVDDEEPAEISASPVVSVGAVADPGDVLINEIIPSGGGVSVELYNPDEVDLTGWVLATIDGESGCEVAGCWQVEGRGDLTRQAHVIVGLGGEGAQPDAGCAVARPLESVRGRGGARSDVQEAYTALLLYTDETLTYLVDAVEYRDPAFFEEDPCPGSAGLGGPDDAWVPAPIPTGYSLGRDELSTDTDSSLSDLFLSSTPTPGEANVPYDQLPPEIGYMQDAGSRFALVRFNEPVDQSDAENIANYDAGGALGFHRAWVSRDERTVLLSTDTQDPGTLYTVTISGIRDPSGNLMEEDSTYFVGRYELTTPISEIQQYDENGYSPLVGQSASVVGFTTVPPGVFQADRTNMYIQDLEGWGVNVYRDAVMPNPPREGDLVEATGSVLDYVSASSGAGATTEIDADNITVLARGFDLVQPAVRPTGEVGREEYEGTLIKSSGVVVSVEGFAIYIDDGSGAVQVYQNFSDLDFGQFAVGDSLEITGVLLQYDQTVPFFSGYELAPRYPSDMVIRDAQYAGQARLSTTARVLDKGCDEAVEISYNAPRASQVTVRIFDLKGREVATLYSGICLGPSRATWDGRDESGSKVPAGVYICHVLARDRLGAGGSDTAVPIVVGTKLD